MAGLSLREREGISDLWPVLGVEPLLLLHLKEPAEVDPSASGSFWAASFGGFLVATKTLERLDVLSGLGTSQDPPKKTLLGETSGHYLHTQCVIYSSSLLKYTSGNT